MKKIILTALAFVFCLDVVYAQQIPELTYQKNYEPGTYDVNDLFMGGTEILWLVPHQGKLMAGVGYWRDEPGSDPASGAQLLIKESSSTNWKVFKNFGLQYLRVDALASLQLTTDADGNSLSSPFQFLAVGTSDQLAPFETNVWIYDDNEETWHNTILGSDAVANQAYVRQVFTYKDKVTGIDYIFAATASGKLYKGTYSSGANHKILWESTPELNAGPNKTRIHSFTVANGDLYISRGVAPTNPGEGGLFRRIDGENPQWHHVYEWDLARADDKPGMRGITAVADPVGGSHQVIIGAVESTGTIHRIDPENDHVGVIEFNFKDYFIELWGSLGGGATLAAYNDMLPVKLANDQTSHLLGLWVNHPQRSIAPYSGSRFLARFADGTYSYQEMFDYQNPIAQGQELRGCRTIVASPFSNEPATWYFGGYDAGGAGKKHNTAWIYKGAVENRSPGKDLEIFSNIQFQQLPDVNKNLQSLDIYAPKNNEESMPVILYVHGGGWHQGDKANLSFKADFFTRNSFVFISTNYRLSPSCPPCSDDIQRLKHPAQVQDVAAAISWVHENIDQYQGDPEKIMLLGHSAGGHLVSLVSTNEKFLQAQGQDLDVIKGTVSLDAAAFDMKFMIENGNASLLYLNAFGNDENLWADASPAYHTQPGKNIAPFLLVHQSRESRTLINEAFADSLKKNGHEVELLNLPYSHEDINRLLGATDQSYNTRVLNFYRKQAGVPTNVASEHGISDEIFLYPNPASDVLYLNVAEPVIVKVYTPTGKMKEQIVTGSGKINVSNWPRGLYILQLVNDCCIIETLKVILE